MAEEKEIQCPDCRGKGKKRDWLITISSFGMADLIGGAMDEEITTKDCDRCGGYGRIVVSLREENG